MELTDSKILVRATTTTKEVPYCDTFKVEEEFYLASMGGTNSCILNFSANLVFSKYVLMKTIIVN